MQYHYCKSWFRAKKVPIQVMSADAARALHDQGQMYTVLVDSDVRPTAFIEVTPGSAMVGFLDDFLRENLSYTFKATGDGRLFLSMATYREFREESDVVASGTNYVFSEDGALSIRRQSFSPATSDITNSSTNVSGNYEHYPAFGEYDPLLKPER